ncbi:hypothetical protein LG634_11740 [Streptomyces bambusae]|uniref:hypothetical protein n=1 Tax=Streptomyces bambusae TaxID=1550616 RepID=UPI001CFE7D39|nr:hypothetical protein [Streptomyces bambusae]MCB5165501.1 hypothetical protein [Streptomyces bambusae]
MAASPAAADGHVPVAVPLDAVESAVGLPAPKIASGVPLLTPGAIEGPTHHQGELLPNPLLPPVPLAGELAPTLIGSELPGALNNGKPDEADVTSTRSPLLAQTPGAVVGAPLSMPDGSRMGLPELVTPKLGVVAPALQGDPGALLRLH